MKKILFFLVITTLLVGCGKDDEGQAGSPLKGTSWTATDDIAELLYGKTCTTTIEFLDNENCQQIDKRVGMKYGAGTFVKAGTYYMKADSVIFTVDGSTTRGKVTGSTIVTTMRNISFSGQRTYTKD